MIDWTRVKFSKKNRSESKPWFRAVVPLWGVRYCRGPRFCEPKTQS